MAVLKGEPNATHSSSTERTGMADKNAPGMIGLMLGAATMFVTVMGAIAVGNHGGQLDMRTGTPVVATLPASGR